MPISTVTKALQFRLEQNLCVEKNHMLLAGPTYTHLAPESPFANKHRQNWRLKGLSMMEQRIESDVFYTSPMSVSREDFEKIRSLIVNQIQEIVRIMRPSDSEKACCLNVDWFEY